MDAVLLPDDLLSRLPLPLMQLYRRARNAKTPQDRHHHAFYLAEATLKLAACLRIAAVLNVGPEPGSPLAEALEHLCLPSVGHWVGFLRETTEYLARKPLASPALAASHEPLLRRDVFAAVRAFAQRATKGDAPPLAPEQADAGRQGILGFFNLVAAYRNQVFGHGAQRLPAFYEEFGPLLLAAVCEVLGQDCLFAGMTLALARLAPSGAGQVRVEWQGLRGGGLLLTPEKTGSEPDDSEAAARAVAGQVFFVGPGVRLPLHPLVVYREDGHGRERVGFLNRTVMRRKGPGGVEEVRRCEYLDYATGDELREIDARRELTDVLARLRGQAVSEAEVDQVIAAGEVEPHEQEQPLGAGLVLGDFELAEELGSGAMGVVYRARQRSLNRWVALKVLRPALAADPSALARFRREVEALARCEHPHLVKVLTSGRDGDRHYFAMELVEGADLARVADVLRGWKGRGPLRESHISSAVASSHGPPPGAETTRHANMDATRPATPGTTRPATPGADATRLAEMGEGRPIHYRLAELFADAADAVVHLHAHGILHRDLKPANLMVTADGRRLVVMDLGLAQLRDASRALTKTGPGWVGTLRYCAPEQVQKNLLEVDERADVYGLGATFYEATTLAPLFDGDTEPRLLTQVLSEEPRDPRKHDPSVPRDLAAVLRTCLNKDRARRYANARDLSADLTAFLAGRPIKARPLGTAARLGRWARGNPWAAGLAAALLLSLTALAAGSTAAAVRIEGARQEAEARKRDAEHQADLLLQANAAVKAEEERAVRGEEAAHKQKDEADRLRGVADQQRQDAERQREEAGKQKDKAVRYFGFAREAVDHFYKEVSEDQLLKTPGMHDLRLSLLNTAREFYEEFVESRGEDDFTITKEDLGGLLLRLADVTAEARSKRRAVDYYLEAEPIFTQLAAEKGDDLGAQESLTAVYQGLVSAYLAEGQWEPAGRYGEKLLDAQKKLLDRRPDNVAYRLDYAAANNNLALVFSRGGQPDKARGFLQTATEELKTLAVKYPDDAVIQWKLGHTYMAQGVIEGFQKAALARRVGEQALACFEKAARLSPDLAASAEFQTDLGVCYTNLAQTALLAVDFDAAEDLARKGIAVEEKLVAARPGEAEYSLDLLRSYRALIGAEALDADGVSAEALALGDKALDMAAQLPAEATEGRWEFPLETGSIGFLLGEHLAENAHWEESAKRLDRAMEDLDRALSMAPGQPNVIGQIMPTLSTRGLVCNRLGRCPDALADFDRLEQVGGKKAAGADLLQRCIALAGTGRYQDAVDTVEKAVGRVPDKEGLQYEMAGLYALASAAAAKDTGVSSGQRERLSRQYAGQAVALLQPLQMNSYFRKPAHLLDLQTNHSLDPIRDNPEFRDILSAAEKK